MTKEDRMITRVRVEAEGGSPSDVEHQLQTAFEVLDNANRTQMCAMFGDGGAGNQYPGLVDAQAGEFVIERKAKDMDGGAGHSAVYFTGRMIVHYAKPYKPLDLRQRSDEAPYLPSV